MREATSTTIQVLVAAISRGLEATLRAMDSREGFSEMYGNREHERWFIEPR
jgi:hypothetical protein